MAVLVRGLLNNFHIDPHVLLSAHKRVLKGAYNLLVKVHCTLRSATHLWSAPGLLRPKEPKRIQKLDPLEPYEDLHRATCGVYKGTNL